MGKKRILGLLVGCIAVVAAVTTSAVTARAKKTTYIASKMEPITKRKKGIYEKHLKRTVDVVAAAGTITLFSPIYLAIALMVKMKLGSPIIFSQDRPGIIDDNGQETVFKMYKFRTMTDERDSKGNLLPDDKRLTPFGAWLRKTSLDELPEAFNILNGTMSLVGPRPQLVRDMTFMTEEQRARHTAKPGLTGLAQVNGRNDISWEDKLNWDLKYIEKVSFTKDIKILIDTFRKALIKQEGITQEGMATAEDFGDYLLRKNAITKEEYDCKQQKARQILSREDDINRESNLVSIIMPSYNTGEYIADSIESVINQTYKEWELIIIDDCSTDNTDNKIQSYLEDKRIRYYKNEKNIGAAENRNRALREAKGKWIAFLDSDDLWLPEKLEKQISFMEENQYSFTYTNYKEIDVDGNLNGIIVTGPKKITKIGMYNYCWPGCLTVMYDADKLGLLQIRDIKKNNDYAMWLKLCKKADCYLLDENLALYRRGRKGSISTQSITTMLKWHYRLFRDAEGQNMVTSIFNTFRNAAFGMYKRKVYKKR